MTKIIRIEDIDTYYREVIDDELILTRDNYNNDIVSICDISNYIQQIADNTLILVPNTKFFMSKDYDIVLVYQREQLKSIANVSNKKFTLSNDYDKVLVYQRKLLRSIINIPIDKDYDGQINKKHKI